MNTSTAIPKRGYLFVILAALMWAVSGTAGKFLFQHGMTPLQLVQLRLTLSILCILVWTLARNPRLLIIEARDIPYFAVLGVFGMAMVQITYLYAISQIQVAVAVLLQYLAPAFIALHAVIFAKEKLSLGTAVAVVGTTAGCYLVVGAYNFDLLAMNWKGITVGICSGVAFAWYAIHGERGMRRYSPWTVLFHAILFAAIFWNIALPPFESFRRAYSLTEWSLIGYIVIFGTVVPYGLYTEGINLVRATRASVTATLEPITAALISYLFLGESLEPFQLLGGALVIGSIVFLQLRRECDDCTPDLIRARKNGSV